MTRHANAESRERVEARVVFDRNTGAILHVHEAVALSGAELPRDAELALVALQCASAFTGRRIEEMDTLVIADVELPLAGFRVDLQNKRVVRSPG